MGGVGRAVRPVVRAIRLQNRHIFDQLCIEEALFYKTKGSWLVFNEGSKAHPPAIVLGISGKPHKLCNLDLVKEDAVPLIKRFSGGGTVVVDDQTLFCTIIMDESDLPECKPYPREIMEWTTKVYGPAFSNLVTKSDAQFGLRENDYVFGKHKFAGNAQAISRGRWLHHTSFLWSWSERAMAYLSLPEKRPDYRGDREHSSFLCPLKDHVGERTRFWPEVVAGLGSAGFDVEEVGMGEVEELMEELGGWAKWSASCRTKFIDAHAKTIPQPTTEAVTEAAER